MEQRNTQRTLLGNLRATVRFLATYKLKASPYFRLGITASALRFVIYTLGHTVFLLGSEINTALSIISDLLVLAVAILTTFRFRDIGMKGRSGFFFIVIMVYGLAICLYLWLNSSQMLSQITIFETIGIAPMISQAVLVWLFAQFPSNIHRHSIKT